MGYCGMRHISGSDHASDMCAVIEDEIVKSLTAHLSTGSSNEYNTDDFEDVALFFKDVIVPAAKKSGVFLFSEGLVEIAVHVSESINKKINRSKKESAQWDPGNLKEHLKDWKSMLKSLQWFIENSED